MLPAAVRFKQLAQEGLADLTIPELEETESTDQITDDATPQSTEEPSQAIVADKAESQPEATAPTKKKKKEPTCTEASIPKDMYIDNFFDRVTGKAARDVLVNHGGYSLDKLYEILQKYDRDYSDDPLTFFRDLEDKTEETATDQFYQRYLKTLPAMAASYSVTQIVKKMQRYEKHKAQTAKANQLNGWQPLKKITASIVRGAINRLNAALQANSHNTSQSKPEQ